MISTIQHISRLQPVKVVGHIISSPQSQGGEPSLHYEGCLYGNDQPELLLLVKIDVKQVDLAADLEEDQRDDEGHGIHQNQCDDGLCQMRNVFRGQAGVVEVTVSYIS